MDTLVLRKRLSTFKAGKKGVIRKVSDDVVLDVLKAWENWPGSSADLYRELGLSKMQMAIMIKKGKRLVKSGVVTSSEFSELKTLPPGLGSIETGTASGGIELAWDNGRIIRFFSVDHLLDFLRKAA